ncbi:MAG: phosphatidylserine/phosphatidylglycerophosphate/cardiolipin synthase family protein [Acidobacteriota bacterium]
MTVEALDSPARAGRTPRPRSQPRIWRAARARRRPASRARASRPKGRSDLFTRVRRAVWTWWAWGAAAVAMAARGHWGWAAARAGVATVARLLEPRAWPPRFGLDCDVAVASPEFLATLAGATGAPFVAGNSFELLHNGDAFYPRMLDDIRRARASICIEAYIYWAGEVGRQFAEALAERARAGVPVMILLDAVGAADIGDDIIAVLDTAGCRIAWYNPLALRTIGNYNNRTHRKSLILDGAIAYTGGAGIADHWRGDARGPDQWRDVQVRFCGPAAAGLQSGFAHNWQRTNSELVSGALYFPTVQPSGPHALQVVLSSPETGGSNVQTLYYLAIAGARHTIEIANPYFVPDEVALDVLVEAARRGVRVRVMVSGRRNDNWLARQNGISRYGRLLAAGIEILEYNRSMLHHKVMVVDGQWLTVGTTNFDNRSFAHNEESNLTLFDRTQAEAFVAVFERDTAACARVELDAWRRRGLWPRTQEAVARLFEDQV